MGRKRRIGPLVLPAEKQCKQCLDTKTIANYYVNDYGWASTYCKPCHIEKSKYYNKKRKEIDQAA